MARRVCIAVAVVVALAGGPARAQIAPQVEGPAEVVFDWARDRCATWDVPDTPARAWRGRDGRVRLVSGSQESRASVGPELDSVARDCGVLHRGAGSDDPGAYDDRAWIHSTYRLGGDRVLALAHEEYHGHRRPERCPAADYVTCWRNAIVELVSDDGGRSFRRAGVVAASPYRYTGAAGRRTGYFNPSNIVRRGDFLYAFLTAGREGAQRPGPCLMRRPVDGGSGDWRAWDGAGFGVRFADPYREDAPDPARHVCAPLPGLASTLSGVVEHAPSGRWLAVTATTRTGADGVARSGVWWTTSADLVRWSVPALLWEAPLLWRRDCGAEAAYAYPALLDDDAGSDNFETVNGRFWLYITEMPLVDGCRIGPERDLVRIPVSWPGP